jgi:hypothetical protein
MGQAVFDRGRGVMRYITPDVTGHGGYCGWKVLMWMETDLGPTLETGPGGFGIDGE